MLNVHTLFVSLTSYLHYMFSSSIAVYTAYNETKSLLGEHYTHLKDLEDEQINSLLDVVFDADKLLVYIKHESDNDTKQVFYYLFKVSFWKSTNFIFFIIFA